MRYPTIKDGHFTRKLHETASWPILTRRRANWCPKLAPGQPEGWQDFVRNGPFRWTDDNHELLRTLLVAVRHLQAEPQLVFGRGHV